MLEELKEWKQWIVWKTINGRKVPIDPNTGKASSSTAPSKWTDYETAYDVWNRNPDYDGLGFVFSSDDPFFGIDIDKCLENGEWNSLATDVLTKMKGTYAEQSPSGNGLHVIGKGQLPSWSNKKNEKLGLEIYDKARYFTVTFDLIDDHPGDAYDAQEALRLICVEYLLKQQRKARAENENGEAKDIPVFAKGERDDSLFEVARSLYHKGCSKWQAYAALERIADNCQPPVERSVARQKVDSAWKSEDPDLKVVIEELNQRYAVMSDGSILIEPEDPNDMPRMVSYEALKRYHAPYKVRYEDREGRVKRCNSIEYWIGSAERRAYDRIVFKPNGDAPKHCYNLWNGFATKPKKGSCEMFLRHVRENVARGDQEAAEWFLDWLAAVMQDPGKGPKTAVIMKGGQGTGKTCIGDYLRNIIGDKHYQKFTNADHFLGRFNYDVAMAVLVHLEEALFGGAKKTEGALKSLITDRRIRVEMKGKDRFEIDNNAHLLITTNEEWPVPIAEDDRRFYVFDLGPKHSRASDEFFEALFREMDGDGPAALLDFLLKRELKSTNPMPPKPTKAHGHIQKFSLDAVGKAMVNWVESEKVGARAEWVRVIPQDEIYEDYRREAQAFGVRSMHTKNGLRKRLEEFLECEIPAVRRRNPNTIREEHGIEIDESLEQGRRVAEWFWVLPSLDYCKQQLERLL